MYGCVLVCYVCMRACVRAGCAPRRASVLPYVLAIFFSIYKPKIWFSPRASDIVFHSYPADTVSGSIVNVPGELILPGAA